MSPPKSEGVHDANGEEQKVIAISSRKKPLDQSGNKAQLCRCLVVKAKSDAVKNNIA